MSPIRLESSDTNSERVGRVICERTKLEGEPFEQRPVGTNEEESLEADLVLVSIGYKGMPLDGMERLGIFDNQKGTVANEHGKVTGDNNIFVAGWIKRGPSGIIGTNISDAKDTVASIMKFIDSQQAKSCSKSTKGRVGLNDILQNQGVQAISWEQFLKIDAAETKRSILRSDIQPREKILTIEEMLKVSS
jgi:NADPH-dependent glutamate synthase beta subunit-like oxidoreductase